MVGVVRLGCKIDIFACMIPIFPLNNAVEQAKSRVSARCYPTFALVCDNFFSVITLRNLAICFAYATLRANNCRNEQSTCEFAASSAFARLRPKISLYYIK